jgi:hypothetical protein
MLGALEVAKLERVSRSGARRRFHGIELVTKRQLVLWERQHRATLPDVAVQPSRSVLPAEWSHQGGRVAHRTSHRRRYRASKG